MSRRSTVTTPKGVTVTRTSVREYLAKQRERYAQHRLPVIPSDRDDLSQQSTAVAASQLLQKNGAIVRALVGYDRYASRAAYAQLARVYRLLRLHTNFFQPVQRLVAKSRHGARVRRWHDRAQTPYQRLAAAGVLSPERARELRALYETLNPLGLRRDIDAALAVLWRLSSREPAPPSAADLAIAPG